jgi:hypothetical protein
VTFAEVEGTTNGKEKSKGPEWPQEAPYEEHYMTKPPIKNERPFSEQGMLAPIASVPPQYGNEHEAAREDAIARSEHIEELDKTNLLGPNMKDTKRRRLRRHCMRYWICYCIGLLLFQAILLPILYAIEDPGNISLLTLIKIPRHLPSDRARVGQEARTYAMGGVTSRAFARRDNLQAQLNDHSAQTVCGRAR